MGDGASVVVPRRRSNKLGDGEAAVEGPGERTRIAVEASRAFDTAAAATRSLSLSATTPPGLDPEDPEIAELVGDEGRCGIVVVVIEERTVASTVAGLG